ncbi:MAG: AAA family ATPase [Bacteroidaceae bacterium]|nr:AAA family ATPase [Bacteroidaceae bacterium]
MKKDHLFELAENYISQTGISVFLTGRAGTGKTTFLKYIVENTPKRCVVLAPTGVAAINAGGVTIHSFFQLPLCPYLPDVKELVTEYQMPEARRQLHKEKVKIIKTLDLLIIDEISMVRADLMDAIDAVMRRYRHNDLPFGGVQLLMIGDAHQLPPVVTDQEEPWLRKVYKSPFFFHSKVMQNLRYVTIELQTVYRQSDQSFLEILNSIRDGVMDNDTYRKLNSRLDPRFNPDDSIAVSGSRWIRLTTHNRQADSINQERMEALKSKLYTFYAEIEGNFPENTLPAEKVLQLKEGAQVMFLRNDSRDGRYYNGKIATVTEIDYDTVTVTDENGDEINVPIEKWDNIRYEIDKETKEIVPIVDGTFSQYPLRAAWAVTIHKSQGLTFDNVIIDAASAFSFGQVYVALSRCRTLEGIVLSSPISQSCLYNNSDVSGFHEQFLPVSEMEKQLENSRQEYYMSVLKECFSFARLERLSGWAGGIFNSHLKSTYPEQTTRMEENRRRIRDMEKVAATFRAQLDRIGPQDISLINERVSKAAGYFLPILIDVASDVTPIMSVSIDNKEVKNTLSEASGELLPELTLHLQSMRDILDRGFSIESYLKIRNDALLSNQPKTSVKKAKEPKPVKEKVVKAKPSIEEIYSDNRHPELIEPLIEWRTGQYLSQNIRAYWVLTQRTLLEIADKCPTTREELLEVNGFGPAKWKQYGEEILEIIAKYRKS